MSFVSDQIKIHPISEARNIVFWNFIPQLNNNFLYNDRICWPGCVAQSVGHLTRKSGVLGSIPGLAAYFHFSFRIFKKGSSQLLAKVCARSTG